MAATKKKRKTNSRGTYVPQTGLAAKIALVEGAVPRPDLGGFKPGDTVKVHVKIKEGDKERIQAYEGVVIARQNVGTGRSFTVRKISHGVGVERIFMESSPRVAKVEVIQEGKVRRAKLYYLRGREGKAARVERDLHGASSEAGKAAAAAAVAAKTKPAAN